MENNGKEESFLEATSKAINELWTKSQQTYDKAKKDLLYQQAKVLDDKVTKYLESEESRYLVDIDLDKFQKAQFFNLQGLCLDISSVYEKRAEEILSKSIRMNPNEYETFNILGHTLWKKGDLEGSKN